MEKLLNAEIEELKKSSFSKPIKTLYIGGGSPASIGSPILCGFLSRIVEMTGKPEEFTVEINPSDADKDLFVNLKKTGVNRISIGAQSFILEELDFLGRQYKVEKIEQTINDCKSAGFKIIGLDLIFAVPQSNIESWKLTLKKAIDCDVQHISTYSLSFEENTPLERKKSAGKMKPVDEEIDRKMYEITIEELAKAGFEHYEISNFAKPGFKCRHNLAYWKNDFYIGIGPAAASYIGSYRIENINDIEKYVECIEQNKDSEAEKTGIGAEEKAVQTAVLGLRLIEGIDLTEYQEKTGFDIYKLFGKSIEKNLKLNLLQLKDNRLSLTEKAMPIADGVLSDFALPD